MARELKRLDSIRRHPDALPTLVYALVALAVLLPLLAPGHILTLDMALTPRLPMPDSVTPSYLFRAGLHFINTVVPTEIIEKLLFLLILLLSGIGMHRLMQHLRPSKGKQLEQETWGMYVAGLLYMINPYTYSRFMAGQYSVLLGYALMPFFVRACLKFFAEPTRRLVVPVAGWAILISIVSIHTVGLIAIVTLLAAVLYSWRHRRQTPHVRAMFWNGLQGLGLVLLASSYWLVPLAKGTSTTAQAINRFGVGDQFAFATVGAGFLGKLANVVRLQGFWAEDRGLYHLPQSQVPAWGLIGLAVWALVVVGGISMWKRWKRSEVLILGGSALLAAVLATGMLTGWLADHTPFFAGYREPHKFVGLVALAYAVFLGQGATELLHRYKHRSKDTLATIATVTFLLIPVAFTPTMFWGFGGQLQARAYPADWFIAREHLARDSKAKALFLPWHLYMHFGFADRITVNPAHDFFGEQVIISDDLEFQGASANTHDSTKAWLGQGVLPEAPHRQDLARQLTSRNIKYILLAKESEASKYSYLDQQDDVHLRYEGPTIKLYELTPSEDR